MQSKQGNNKINNNIEDIAARIAAKFVVRVLEHVFSWRRQTYLVCETHTQRSGRGWPLAERIAVHTREDGKISKTSLRVEEENRRDYITREEFYSALGQISLPLESPPDEENSET